MAAEHGEVDAQDNLEVGIEDGIVELEKPEGSLF
jgi:hypothetical protein